MKITAWSRLLAAVCGWIAIGAHARVALVALTAGQAVQVNVINDHAGSVPPCHFGIAFANLGGEPLSDPSWNFSKILPGQHHAVQIAHPNLTAGDRFHVRVIVRKFEAKASPPLHECAALRAIVDVYDVASGKTTLQVEVSDD